MLAVYLEFAQFGDFDSFDIFRSTSPMDVNNLPTPFATGLMTMYFRDTQISEGATYYYIVRVNKGSERILSSEVSVSETPDSEKPTLREYIVSGKGFDAVDYAVTQVAGIKSDWYIDDANGLVKYRKLGVWSRVDGRQVAATAEQSCELWPGGNGYVHHSTKMVSETLATCVAVQVSTGSLVDNFEVVFNAPPLPNPYIDIPIADILTRINNNAVDGHLPSRAALANTYQ